MYVANLGPSWKFIGKILQPFHRSDPLIVKFVSHLLITSYNEKQTHTP